MLCFAANSASVNSPRIASSATFALKSAVYRLRVTLPIQSRPSHRREQLNRLSGFQGPPLRDWSVDPCERKTARCGSAGACRVRRERLPGGAGTLRAERVVSANGRGRCDPLHQPIAGREYVRNFGPERSPRCALADGEGCYRWNLNDG
jgi:hypothetical protein